MTPAPSLRTYLADREACGDLVEVQTPVRLRYELAAHLSLRDGGPVVRFGNVEKGFDVVGNVLGTKERIAAAIGTTPAEILNTLDAAIASRQQPVLVADGPVREREYPVDLEALPIPTFFEREERPYITSGVIIARDPRSGMRNASFARVGLLGGNRAMIGIAPNHHLQRLAEASDDGRLEIAVVIGAHPAVQLAACFYLGLGDDELEHVPALMGAPLEVLETRHGLRIPAQAEFVLEGTLNIRDTITEGFVSEYHGMYEDYGSAATAEFHRITGRNDAMFQTILPGRHLEHIYLGALPIAAGLRTAIARSIPNVRDVSVIEAGGGRVAAVVQLADPRPGHAKQAMMAAWGSLSMLKQVTIVDTDIDVWDPVEVEWARIARCRLERDLVVVADARTDRSEPLESGGTVTKIGYDALCRAGDRVEGFDRAEPPAAVLAEVARSIAGDRVRG